MSARVERASMNNCYCCVAPVVVASLTLLVIGILGINNVIAMSSVSAGTLLGVGAVLIATSLACTIVSSYIRHRRSQQTEEVELKSV